MSGAESSVRYIYQLSWVICLHPVKHAAMGTAQCHVECALALKASPLRQSVVLLYTQAGEQTHDVAKTSPRHHAFCRAEAQGV